MCNPTPVLDHVYTVWIDYQQSYLRIGIYDAYIHYPETFFFETLCNENRKTLNLKPRHNKYVNFYAHKVDDVLYRPRDVTPIHTPSRLFVFSDIKETLVYNPQSGKEEEPTECTMLLERPDPTIIKSLLFNCRKIRLCATNKGLGDVRSNC